MHTSRYADRAWVCPLPKRRRKMRNRCPRQEAFCGNDRMTFGINRLFHNLSQSRRLTTIGVVVFGAACVALFVGLIVYDFYSSRARIVHDAEVLASVVMTPARQALATGDTATADAGLASIASATQLRAAAIIR